MGNMAGGRYVWHFYGNLFLIEDRKGGREMVYAAVVGAL